MKLFNYLIKLIFIVISINILFSSCFENTNTITMKNKNSSTEKSKLNSEIFLREKVFKYKNLNKLENNNTNKNKLISSFQNKNEIKSNSNLNSNSKNTIKNQLRTIETTGSILFNSWIKYFKYSDGAINSPLPKGFNKNDDYYEQRKNFPNIDYSQKNGIGSYEYIRDQNYFYLFLFENVVTINSSKLNKSRKLVDTFSISEIANIFEDSKDNKKNGILDYGKFNEGYCMKVATKNIENSVYIICLETELEKDDLLKKLRSLKIQEQHNKGLILLANSKVLKQETLGSLLGKKSNNPKTKKDEKNSKPTDGYWITLQDWSQCSKKCDSGISTFQRMCVPPKNGGKPCEGDAIITKKCNEEPCPLVKNNNIDLKSKNKDTTVLDPIVKIMPFSDKPQRFSLCKIKESDLMIYEDGSDPIKKDHPLFKGKKIDEIGGLKLPCRVIMNIQTLTVFAGEKFETLYLSFNLKNTRFYEAKNKKNCFRLYESSKKYITLCPYTAEISTKEYDEWKTDFEVFKTRCQKPKKNVLNDEEQKALDEKINKKMNEAKKQALDEAKSDQQLKRATQTQGDLAVLVKNTHNVAMKAIQKEQALEDLIKQETEEKNRLEEERMLKLIEEEKKKKDCVLKAIKEKQLENQIEEKAKEIKQTIAAIKQEAAAQVLIKRNNLKKVLNKINQKAALKRNKLRQELLNVRMSIANELGKAYKKGDVNKCIDAVSSPNKRNNYCIATFSEDFTNLSYCKNTEDFCELCCGAEFGNMLSNDKENCIKKVCPRNNKAEDLKAEEGNSGRWIAQPGGSWTYQKVMRA